MPAFSVRPTRRKPKSTVVAGLSLMTRFYSLRRPMPELPEVETVMRGLRARLEGRVIRQAAVHRADMRWAFPPGLAARLTGATVTGFRRRAKYILMRLSGGDSVLIHLGMSGRILITLALPNSVALHEHFSLDTDEG